jgi:hypothetical protein
MLIAAMSGKRMLLLGVAGLLSATAVLAIAILATGRFDATSDRILGTTALLAGFGLIALPAAALLDQQRYRWLALATASLSAAGAACSIAAIWAPNGSETLAKTAGSVTALGLACAQVSALAARRRQGDPAVVRQLFVASCATGLFAASLIALAIWNTPHGSGYWRLVGSLLVLDILLVALQPILARARSVGGRVHRLNVGVAGGEPVAVTIEGGDLASAAAKAIRSVERDGGRVTGIEVTEV